MRVAIQTTVVSCYERTIVGSIETQESKIKLSLELSEERLAILRLSPETPIPEWALRSKFFSISRTSDELSIVCEQRDVLSCAQVEPNWVALKVKGPLDFSLTGILAAIAQPLAQADISIFAISTFDTDYVLVKEEKIVAARAALELAGHRIRPQHRPLIIDSL